MYTSVMDLVKLQKGNVSKENFQKIYWREHYMNM